MGSITLKHFLQSLCFNTHWNYAVFWKLRHENQLLLTWEDGCCDHAELRGSMERILGDDMCFNGSNEIFSSSLGSSRHDGHSGKYSIGQTVADMAGFQYQWGEGVVGEVAYTGNHCWVLRENIFKSKVVPACPDEWLLQFAAGIQTIVLVPAIPHGVLQLGTVEKVAEDVALVAYIRDKLIAYQNGADLLPLTNMPIIMDNLDEPSASFVNQMKSEDPKAVYGVKQTNSKLSTTNQITSVCLVQDPCRISRKDMLDILNCTRENEISFQSTVFEVSKPLYQPFNETKSEMIEGSVAGYSSVEEELQDLSFPDNYDVGIFGEHANITSRDMVEQPFVDPEADNRDCKNISNFFCFPMDCELHKALGSAFPGQTKQYLCDSSLVSMDACNRSSPIFNADLIQNVDQSTCGSSGCFDKRDDVEHLLEAVVAGVSGGLNDNLCKNPSGVKLSVTSLEQFAASTKRRSWYEESEYVDEKSVPRSSLATAFGARGQIAVSKSPRASSFESMMSTLTWEQRQKNGFCYKQTRKGSKLPNARKRNARPGESQRPRPRDRQLIQDRLKELRLLVPNGSTCSIDGLLEKTINHMLFLRSATDQADKLRQWVDQEVTRQKNMKSSDTKLDQKNDGASWAFELGSDLQVCPIVVEDLDCPGHMLIKMLCSDHGLFLEIAEVLRRLGLTILKGVRESCADNTWAHFIVEVSRGFHRLDIFWPLMQLLQQNQSPISSKI